MYHTLLFEDIKDYVKSITNQWYGYRSICQNCKRYIETATNKLDFLYDEPLRLVERLKPSPSELIKTEVGTHFCLDCIIMFNQMQLENQMYTFLCTKCGNYFYLKQLDIVSLTHCNKCNTKIINQHHQQNS